MKLIKDNKVITEQDFRNEFKDTSFGPVINYNEFGYEVVFDSPQPQFNHDTQRAVEIDPVKTDKGHWEQQWEVIDLTPEEVAIISEQKTLQSNEQKLQQIISLQQKALRSLIEDGDDKTYFNKYKDEIAGLRSQIVKLT